MRITEVNVAEYIGRSIRAEKSSDVLEGKILGRSEAIVATRDGNIVHPVKIETDTEIRHVDLTDGWKITLQ